jgi:hypothetical protein
MDEALRVNEKFKCTACDVTWVVVGLTEMGAWRPFNEDNTKCPDCKEEGEETPL